MPLEWRTLCDPPEVREGRAERSGNAASAHNLRVSPVENQIVSDVTGLSSLFSSHGLSTPPPHLESYSLPPSTGSPSASIAY